MNAREPVAQQLGELATSVRKRDAAVGELLARLATAVKDGRYDEVKAYAAALDPRSLAELLTVRRSAMWAVLEVIRNTLVFAPIAVTWFGLATASAAYETLLKARPELISRPFLLLWQESFEGTSAVLSFSTLAIIDASLIALLIVLSLTIHVRADVRDVSTRTRVLLRESEIRLLLGHALSLSAGPSLTDASADTVLDEMVAEERRIYERAMEREQQLTDLQGVVRDLRVAATISPAPRGPCPARASKWVRPGRSPRRASDARHRPRRHALPRRVAVGGHPPWPLRDLPRREQRRRGDPGGAARHRSRPVAISMTIDGPKLLGFDAAAGADEQRRIATAVKAQVAQQSGGHQVAIVIAFASNADPSIGDDISRLATAQLTGDAFAGATIKTYHSIVAGDRGSTLDLEIYVYR